MNYKLKEHYHVFTCRRGATVMLRHQNAVLKILTGNEKENGTMPMKRFIIARMCKFG